jgi:2-dehydropantoate 2-reductase
VRATRSFETRSTWAAALAGERYAALLLTVKAYDVAAIVADLQTALAGAAPPPIVALHNGVGSEALLAQAFGAGPVLSGSVTTPVSKQAHGLVIEKARGMGLALGHPLSGPLAAALNASGVRTWLYPAAGPLKWSKLLTNLVGNATSAILDLPVAEIYASPRLYALEKRMLWECLMVMRALRYPVVNLPGAPARWLGWAVQSLPNGLARPILGRFLGAGRGGKMPSLNLDVQGGRGQTEVAWLNGAVAREGAALNILAPVNRVLTETVEALTAGRVDRAAFRHKPQALLALIDELDNQAGGN